MVDGMSAAAVETGAMQVEELPWCKRLMLRHETRGSMKGLSRP